MDLFVLGTIVVVFLVLLAASLLVNKMPSGKTFEEVQAEKKQLDAQMKQQSRPAKQKGGGTKAKASKAANGGQEKKGKKQPVKIHEEEEQEEETAAPHVEFAEEEVIYLSDDMPVAKKSTGLNSNKQQANNNNKKNNTEKKKNKSKAGILVNKNEQTPKASAQQVVAEPNHFEEIHPKDDVEMLKAQKEESTNKGGKPQKNAVNELRKEKKGGKTAAKPQPQKSGAAHIVVPSDVADIEGVEQIIKANEQKLQKGRNQDSVDSVRKARAIRTDNSLQTLQKMVEGTDEISVNVLIMLLSKAELSRSEIQVVIDYLLNKQSDSGAVIKSEWTEGKQDLVARLKKQLAERETQVQNEQEASIAFQEKLKLLRLELNAEKTQSANTAKMYMWEMAQKEKEMEVLASKVGAASTEKAALLVQMQKMQAALVQQKNAMGAQEDHQRQLQQLQEANATMQRELEVYKNTVQVGKVDLRNLENELDSARNEIIQLHQKSFDVSEQMNRDVQVLSGQVSALKAEVANHESQKGQAKNTEEALLRDLAEQRQATAMLQGEVDNYKKAVAEKAALIDKYEADQQHSKGADVDLQRQLDEQKQKNNDLETRMNETVLRSEKELRNKFTHMLTQISVFSNLKLDNGSSTQSSNSNGDSNGTAADLDAWMSKVTAELKKKLDVYESLLSTLRNQLQEKRESSSAKSSAKFIAEANGAAEKKNGNNGTTTDGESNGNGTEFAAST